MASSASSTVSCNKQKRVKETLNGQRGHHHYYVPCQNVKTSTQFYQWFSGSSIIFSFFFPSEWHPPPFHPNIISLRLSLLLLLLFSPVITMFPNVSILIYWPKNDTGLFLIIAYNLLISLAISRQELLVTLAVQCMCIICLKTHIYTDNILGGRGEHVWQIGPWLHIFV